MDAATLKQKAFIRKILVKFGVSRSEFTELDQWKIGKEEASNLITELLILARCGWGGLQEIINKNLDNKNVFRHVTRTVDQLEEEPDYPPDDWEMEVPEERTR